MPDNLSAAPIDAVKALSIPQEDGRPPLPSLTLRVGVVGHRPNKLAAVDLPVLTATIARTLTDIEAQAKAVFEEHPEVFESNAPRFRLLSALAEGADRLVASTALERGYELQCLLPFHREVYAADFAEGRSRDEYHDLLRSARLVFELDGRPDDRQSKDAAYLAVGRLLVRQCDVLIAIWDGQPASGPGGTGELVHEAIALEIPVLHIRSCAPYPVVFRGAKSSGIGKVLRERLAPPAPDAFENYATERLPVRKPVTFDFLLKLLGDGRLTWPARVSNGETKIRLPGVWRFYLWADRLAILYAARHRGATIWMYASSWLAVVFALLAGPLRGVDIPPLAGHAEVLFTACELLLIIFIVGTLFRVRHGRWHERWLGYRSLAEHLRVLDFLALVGRTMPEFRPPVHGTEDDPSSRWGDWFFRAIVREVGLLPVRIDPGYLMSAWDKVRDAVKHQEDFHHSTAIRYHRVHESLHRLGVSLFVVTFVLCLVHLTHGLSGHGAAVDSGHSGIAEWLVFGAAVLPAAGAATAGILAQSEFRRLSQRYEAMQKGLREVMSSLPGCTSPITREDIGHHAELAAKILLAEVQDWRVLFKARPPVLPG